MPTPPLISPAELYQQLRSPATAPRLLDVRWELGEAHGYQDYLREHLPGAVYVDMERDLSGPPGVETSFGRHPLPTVDDFEAAMVRCGVDNNHAVVCYDASLSLSAARCWWMLRHFGKEDVRVLDGGLQEWKRLGLALASGPETVEEGHFEVRRGRAAAIDAHEALLFAQEGLLVDARPADRFRGENETIDPVAGHIPGAISLPTRSLLTPSGTFLPAQQLRDRLVSAGVDGTRPVATYCGSGVQAAHLALAIAIAGLEADTPVYIGSWSDWITDPDRPISTGP